MRVRGGGAEEQGGVQWKEIRKENGWNDGKEKGGTETVRLGGGFDLIAAGGRGNH